MAEAAKTEKKARKPQGPRVPKPVFAIVSLKQDGVPVNLSNASYEVSIEAVKDASALVMFFTGGGDPNSKVLQIVLPVEAKPAPTA